MQNYLTTSQLGYWHWYSQGTEQFHHKNPSCCLFKATPTFLSSTPISPLTLTTNLFSISRILLFQECYVNGIIYYVTLGGWPFSLSIIPSRFIQVAVWVNSLFLFIVCEYFILWMYRSWLNDSLVEGHLCCFQFLAITNKALRTLKCSFFVWT